jgi:hypothetical protein
MILPHLEEWGHQDLTPKLNMVVFLWHYFPNGFYVSCLLAYRTSNKKICAGGGKAQNRCNKIDGKDEVPKRRKKSLLRTLTFEWMDGL